MELGKSTDNLTRLNISETLINPMWDVVYQTDMNIRLVPLPIMTYNKIIRMFGNMSDKMLNNL